MLSVTSYAPGRILGPRIQGCGSADPSYAPRVGIRDTYCRSRAATGHCHRNPGMVGVCGVTSVGDPGKSAGRRFFYRRRNHSIHVRRHARSPGGAPTSRKLCEGVVRRKQHDAQSVEMQLHCDSKLGNGNQQRAPPHDPRGGHGVSKIPYEPSRLLGVRFDHQLNFSCHVADLKKRVEERLCALRVMAGRVGTVGNRGPRGDDWGMMEPSRHLRTLWRGFGESLVRFGLAV